MEYRILGPLEIADGERTIEVTAPKRRALLVCLLLRPGEVIPVDVFVEALWEDRPPPSAANLVQVYVSQLRGALGNAAIETHPTGYLAPVGTEQLDAARFERLLADGRAATVAGDPRLGASLLRRGLALWRGPALADVADGSFASTEARRLEELRLVCLEERIGADLALGRHQEVASELAALVAEHPLRERLRGHLMLALYRCGRQADALDAYRDARRTLSDELGLEPSVELRDLERAILQQDESLVAPAPDVDSRSQLPTPATPLVGRELDLAELRALVRRPEARLVTLAGAAGSGKTRLALALAHASGGEFADGCVLVEVAALRDPELVLPAIARSLGISEAPEEPIEATLAAWLSAREVLLIVDNLEHLAEAGTALAGLSAAAPGVTFVITSRRVLHLSGEHVFPVSPLAEDDAVELFVQRARSLEPTFALTDETEADVREICRRLDGLPLAIELAAARTGTLTPRALRERLTTRLSLLTGGPRDLPARQQTLRETLDWSANLLEEHERRALARMAVFPGGCTLESAETVCEADLDVLSTLVDHSLARRADAGEEPRFTLLETVREYGLELLGAERADAERSFALYVRDLVEAADLRGPEQHRWVVRLDAELGNLRAALDYATGSADASTEQRLLAAICRYWWLRGYLVEGRARVEACLARSGDGGPRAIVGVLNGGAVLAWAAGDYGRAGTLGVQALENARTAGDSQEEVAALNILALVGKETGDYQSARRRLAELESVATAAGLEYYAILGKLNLGALVLDSGDVEAAVPLFEEVLAYHRRHGSAEGAGLASLNLGQVEYRLGRYEAARERFGEARKAFDSIGFREFVARALQGLAAVEAKNGSPQEAARLLGCADALVEEIGASAKEFDVALVSEVEAEARGRLGDDGFDAAYAEGAGASLPAPEV